MRVRESGEVLKKPTTSPLALPSGVLPAKAGQALL